MADEKQSTYTFTVEGKKCIVREPGFKELQFGLIAMTTVSGRLDMAGAGLAVLEVCEEKCDKEIKNTPKLLLSLCLQIADTFLDSVEVEIKKN